MDLHNIDQREYSVIVLHDQITDSLLLTQRSNNLKLHPGEICFPGGRWEAQDRDLYITALRELNEELGIEASRVTFVRELKRDMTLMGHVIHPWLASINGIIPYILNPQEVSKIVLVPMNLAKQLNYYIDYDVERMGVRFKSCRFLFNNALIWGVTARIMKQLCENHQE